MARDCLQKLGTARNVALKDIEQMANCEYSLGLVQEQFIIGLDGRLSIGTDPRQFADAEAAFLRAEKLFLSAEKLSKERAEKQRASSGRAATEPANFEHANQLAALSLHRGKLLLAAGRTSDAEPILMKAMEALKKLAADSRLLPDYRQELPAAHAALGELFAATDRQAAAEQAYHSSEAAYENLVESFPHVTRYQASLAATQEALAGFMYQRHDWTGSRALTETAIHHCLVAIDVSPERTPFKVSLQRLNKELAAVCIEQGDHASAARAADETANVVSYCPWGAQYAMESFTMLPALVEKDSHLSKAEQKRLIDKYLAREKRLEKEMLRRSRSGVAFLNDLAWHLGNCAEPRVRDAARALKYAEQAIASDPETAELWTTLGVMRYRNGDWKGCVTALSKASKMHGGKVALDFLFLAMTYWHLENRAQARESFQTAVHLMQKDPASNKEMQPFRAEAEALLGLHEHWAAAK
jgi:tetratricopeptide (TPR) repeat protein